MCDNGDAFSGTWIMDPEKSRFDPNHRPSKGTMRFDREPFGYTMRAEGESDGKHIQEQPPRFILDGQEHPVAGMPEMNAVSFQPDPNTLHVTVRQQGSIMGEGSYIVSPDGATLTATVRGIDAQQRTFETTVVWQRQVT
jgi:hypothetical protein